MKEVVIDKTVPHCRVPTRDTDQDDDELIPGK